MLGRLYKDSHLLKTSYRLYFRPIPNNSTRNPPLWKRFNSTESTTRDSKPQSKNSSDLKNLQAFIDSRLNLKKNFKFEDPIDSSHPNFHKFNAFDDIVHQTLSSSKINNFNRNDQQTNRLMKRSPLFWDSVTKAMDLYNELALEHDNKLSSSRVSALINLLHNGLRINRNQLIKLNKKPDYDSKSFNFEISNFLQGAILKISNDLIAGNINGISEYGLMHLLTSLKEMGLIDRAIALWKFGLVNENLTQIFLQPKCVGVILPLLYETNTYTFEDCQKLYELSSKNVDYYHPNLMCGMISTCLMANENVKALDIYSKLCEIATERQYNYLCDAHLSFIGYCKDSKISEKFLDKAMANEMPYRVNLKVSFVNLFLQNMPLNDENEFDELIRVWKKIINYYHDMNVNIGVLSSLNNTFFEIFFKYCLNDKITGFSKLSSVIDSYNKTLSIDEPFLNIILTKSLIWYDADVIQFIHKNYTLFNIPETIITKRILLKSMAVIECPNIETEILSRWGELIAKLDEMGNTYLANADWAALRDATLTWAQTNQVEKKEDAINRIILYLRVAKTYKPYCRDSRQFLNITEGYARNFENMQKYLAMLDTLEPIEIPELHSLRSDDRII
ncbi:hypothetical protein KAFR_0A04450 [Kazachstania africana CBS 2517]|uniref:Protein RMD9, mitochondrial n=1 Tax=Kazachstania africana (strain ATCC 22294 / BCRC 22015 / CBS 2517 / CECT 1963 / NBRC 1671 / NRRL Y-8276) TaxID=1071382 RepID=H2AND0_KAZAF|nr:hypothetical protein KAFR_0A04450 [Kazachstania africana CBS 2517]CCF55880.1 hypothetical protein KAFR_0A04450 [Kazachstania africana CBS 2517]